MLAGEVAVTGEALKQLDTLLVGPAGARVDGTEATIARVVVRERRPEARTPRRPGAVRWVITSAAAIPTISTAGTR